MSERFGQIWMILRIVRPLVLAPRVSLHEHERESATILSPGPMGSPSCTRRNESSQARDCVQSASSRGRFQDQKGQDDSLRASKRH